MIWGLYYRWSFGSPVVVTQHKQHGPPPGGTAEGEVLLPCWTASHFLTFLQIVSEGNYTALKWLYGHWQSHSCCLEYIKKKLERLTLGTYKNYFYWHVCHTFRLHYGISCKTHQTVKAGEICCGAEYTSQIAKWAGDGQNVEKRASLSYKSLYRVGSVLT